MENINQDNPKHWRYQKNKSGGNLEAMETAKVERDMKNIITYECEEDEGRKVMKKVDADHDALKELNREHQLAICKSFKLRGFTDLNEEGLIKLILKTHKKKEKKVKGVTTMETLKKNKERNLAEKKEKEKKQ